MKEDIFNNLFLSSELAYLRPYICKGNPYEAKIFLTGINPATPIYPKDIEISEYYSIIKDYYSFMEYYKENRKKLNKTEISRTRMGINSLVDWIEKECKIKVIETDIFTYPTKNTDELLKVNKEILSKSVEKFWEVLLEFKPDIIILYGSLTLETFKKLMKDKNKAIDFCSNNDEKIENIEKMRPYARINIENKEIDVLACRHLMYYGKTGKSFENLRENIKKILQDKI